VPARSARRRRWLRRCALAIRVAVGVLTLSTAVLCGILAARTLGRDSPWVWTIALLAGFAVGVWLMGNPAIHRVASRLERAAEDDADAPRRDRDGR
jgi:hypothetical protein